MLSEIYPGVSSQVVPGTWPYDKYPDMPELKAGATVTVLDAEGPGLVRTIHASMYLLAHGKEGDYEGSYPYGAQILLSVFYDGHEAPDIAMPLYEFLGDFHAHSGFYATQLFSKVPMSHNFRLEMPFRKRIRIQLTNPTDQDLMGYLDVQLERRALPKHCGYLFVQRRAGRICLPGRPLCLFEAEGAGVLAAHWLLLEGRAEGFRGGEGLCEGNCEFYLEDRQEPDCRYLGVEDLYGFSWGFQGCHSDGRCAVLLREELDPGARIGLLRCRDLDPIRYQERCRLMLDYTQEYFSRESRNPIHRENPIFSARPRYEAEANYVSCCYFYTRKP